MNITARQKEIFKNLVNQHVKTGEPVGSNFLVAEAGLKVSSATVRNELAELEEAGLLVQPHTSAGRVPSDIGWEFYVNNLMKDEPLAKEAAGRLNAFDLASRESWKGFAKEVAEIAAETAIVAFGKDDIYYTGFCNLFSKPELAPQGGPFGGVNFGAVIDRMNEIIKDVYELVREGEEKILVGKACPFSDNCSALAAKKSDNLFVIFGLTRMDYVKNKSIIKFLTAKK